MVLDGDLRYIPVTVLYDTTTKQYLVEKYQNVVFTRAEPDRFLRESREWTGGVSFGKSTDSTVTCASPALKSEAENKHQSQNFCEEPVATNETQDSFAALPAVATDVPVIARILHGPFFLNQRFTRQSLLDNVRGKKRPLIHISSHFCFKAGDLKKSFLLLGDDKKFSLFDMKDYANLFDGVDLLVLSACKTGALQAEAETGLEIDSLAELSQRLRANSVIAALWDADAVGSGKLMIEIYRQHKKNPKLTKAELLQRAQLSFLKNKIPASENINHPSYWAPFVLYGNFQ
jgi:CHAT domain-containing protein